MEWNLLWKGAALGLSIAAPVGPIGMLCLRRTLEQGRAAGLATGLGAATADLGYGLVAALGLGAISSLLMDWAEVLRLLGAFLLLYLAWKALTPSAATQPPTPRNQELLTHFVSTFVLTAANPMTILSFVGLFAGLTAGSSPGSPLILAAGVFAGSASWWLFLSLLADRFRGVASTRMIWINRASGLCLIGFAVVLLF